jgi:hypothetical protein
VAENLSLPNWYVLLPHGSKRKRNSRFFSQYNGTAVWITLQLSAGTGWRRCDGGRVAPERGRKWHVGNVFDSLPHFCGHSVLGHFPHHIFATAWLSSHCSNWLLDWIKIMTAWLMKSLSACSRWPFESSLLIRANTPRPRPPSHYSSRFLHLVYFVSRPHSPTSNSTIRHFFSSNTFHTPHHKL